MKSKNEEKNDRVPALYGAGHLQQRLHTGGHPGSRDDHHRTKGKRDQNGKE